MKKYIKPEMNVESFKTEDIMVISGGTNVIAAFSGKSTDGIKFVSEVADGEFTYNPQA